MSTIVKTEKSAYPWHTYRDISVCGYVFNENEYLEGEALARYLHQQVEQHASAWDQILPSLNGCYAIIYETEQRIMAAVDHIRSIPLFYAVKDGRFHLSDSAQELLPFSKQTLHPQNAAEFLVAGYVTNEKTLIPGINQLQSGQYVVWDKETLELNKHQHFTFWPSSQPFDLSGEELIEKLHQTHLNTFERLAESLNGRCAVVPLSGGYDSRLIALMLDEVGYDNVHFVSYGPKGNWETKVSKQIAEYLDKPWTYIRTSHKRWHHWFNDEKRKAYTAYSDNLCQFANLQDYPVVKELNDRNLIPNDAVFISGHSGGFTSGAHAPTDTIRTSEELIEYIIKKNFRFWNWENHTMDLKAYFCDKIRSSLAPDATMTEEQASMYYEKWVWKERQPKLIVNSVRIFEYWNFSWKIPVWDKELVNFWLRVPFQVRKHQTLYKKYVEQKQDIPAPWPNSNRLFKLNKKINPLAEPRYGRFLKKRSLLTMLTKSIDTISEESEFPFINTDKLLISKKHVSLSTWQNYREIKQRLSKYVP